MNKAIRRSNGFTLIELMIVVAIVGILAMVAYPSYDSSIKKTRRADAQGALQGLAQAMERHFTSNNTYLGAATGGGNTGAPGIFPSESPLDGSTKFYNLTISAATATTFTLRAAPKGGQAGDGNMELDNTGAKRWDSGDDGFDASDNYWTK
jgi:type IV pilus assembly protein PilE